MERGVLVYIRDVWWHPWVGSIYVEMASAGGQSTPYGSDDIRSF
ncbi:MAG: hypothetical protein OEM02_10370 [Desulfobulbaceae bacterium]|nr:hypothetical protein [Desulfobulbaceae bacterium]